jgi:hypothetical protein
MIAGFSRRNACGRGQRRKGMRLGRLAFAMALAFAAPAFTSAFAEDATPPQTQRPVNPEAKQLAQNLIETVLRASHAAELYAELRRTLAEVYIPALRDTLEGDAPGAAQLDAKSAERLAKTLTFLTYLRRAGDELDPALSESRSAIISDVAEQIARSATPDEVNDVNAILQLPATQKGWDALQAIAKLITGFSYDDAKAFSAFSAWAQNLKLDFSQSLPGAAPGSEVPSKRKIAKAQSFIDDFFRLSHFDEIVDDVRRFVREVYLETALIPEDKRQELSDEVDQFEFNYNMQKAVALAVAPSVVAAALTDEQLETIHKFMRSAACTKAFDLFRNAVHAGTAFTKDDIATAQKSLEDLEKKAKAKGLTADEQKKAQAEWDALGKKWVETLKQRLSPETRSGLEQSYREFKIQGSPI